MPSPEPTFPPAILELLETTLPEGATLKEREDFARGLTLLAELLGEIPSLADESGS